MYLVVSALGPMNYLIHKILEHTTKLKLKFINVFAVSCKKIKIKTKRLINILTSYKMQPLNLFI